MSFAITKVPAKMSLQSGFGRENTPHPGSLRPESPYALSVSLLLLRVISS
jgi:hypothetical protein